MNIKVLAKNIKDASGKTVGIEPSVEITPESGENCDGIAFKQLREYWTDILRTTMNDALKRGLSPDAADKLT